MTKFTPRTSLAFRWMTGLALLATTACAQSPGGRPSAIPNGSTYVALGSSFAAGPGVTESADSTPSRCQRSIDNYAHQLARVRHLQLVDVSCSGATTAHILGPWRELPPQIDAITPETTLVTVTIGGNDVGFAGHLMAASCKTQAAAMPIDDAKMCDAIKAYARTSTQAGTSPSAAPDEAAWAKVEDGMMHIAQEVRRRAPHARLIFVDYIQIVPTNGSCAKLPLSGTDAAIARASATRLAALTAEIARTAGAGLIEASKLSRGHDVCATDPWATGFSRPANVTAFAPFHPNLAAMSAIADTLNTALGHQ